MEIPINREARSMKKPSFATFLLLLVPCMAGGGLLGAVALPCALIVGIAILALMPLHMIFGIDLLASPADVTDVMRVLICISYVIGMVAGGVLWTYKYLADRRLANGIDK